MSSLMIAFRCFQDTLSISGVDELLYLTMELLNSLTEKGIQIVIFLVRISFMMSELISWFYAELNICCKTCQRSLSSIQDCLLYWIALLAIIKTLQIFASVFLRYFKAEWEEWK